MGKVEIRRCWLLFNLKFILSRIWDHYAYYISLKKLSDGRVQERVEIHGLPPPVPEGEDELPVEVDVDVAAFVDLLAIDPLVQDGREPDISLQAPLGHDLLEALRNILGGRGGTWKERKKTGVL